MMIMIDEMLKKRNRTRYWLAKNIGMGYGNLVKLAEGKNSMVRFDTLDRICEVLGCRIEDILEAEK